MEVFDEHKNRNDARLKVNNRYRKKDLRNACEKGDLDRLKDLISHGVYVDGQDKKNKTALMYACEHGHKDIVDLLLEHKAVDVDGQIGVLYSAAEIACNNHNQHIIESFVKHGVHLNAEGYNFFNELKEYSNGNGNSEVQLLDDCKADYVVIGSSIRRTIWMYAITTNQTEIIQLFLRNKIDVNKTDYHGQTALMLACIHCDECVIKLLIDKGADINTADNIHRTALMFACSFNNLDAAKLLISYGCDTSAKSKGGKTLLIHTIVGGSLEIVEFLVGIGFNVNECDNEAMTPLMHASSNGSEEIVQFLIRKGADVNKLQGGYTTAVTYASTNGHIRIVRALIARGANDVRVMTDEPAKNKHLKVVQQLIAPDIYDIKVLSRILLRASRDGSQGEIREILQFKGVSDSVLTCTYFNGIRVGLVELVKLMLVEFHIDVNAKDDNGNTGLMNACEKGQGKIVTLLLDYGADPEVLNNNRVTALIPSFFEKRLKCFEILVNYGVNLTMPQGHILYYAITNNNHRALTILANSRRLVFNGRLLPACYRDLHANPTVIRFGYCNHYVIHRLRLPTVAHLMRIGLFDWAMCPADFNREKIITQAISSGIGPGKVKVGGHFRSLLSLVWEQQPKNKELFKLMLENVYFVPEDYSYLFKIKNRLENPPDFLIEFLSEPPPTLVFLSFLAISKSISLAGSPCLRVNRVNDLPIPRFWKNKLMFGNNNCFN